VYADPSKWSFKAIKETYTPTFLVEFSTFVYLGVARRETGEVGLSLPLGSDRLAFDFRLKYNRTIGPRTRRSSTFAAGSEISTT